MHTYHQRYLNRTYLWIYFLAVLFLLLATSCKTTTQIQVLQPAVFTVPEHTETVVSFNRSIPPKKFGQRLKEYSQENKLGKIKKVLNMHSKFPAMR